MLDHIVQQPQMMLLAGIVLMGWVLIRRQLRARYRQNSQSRHDHELAKRLARADAPQGIPLASAPPETQRWQAEMLELQRELKAELDTKIVVVQTLIRQADERISQLTAMKQP